MEDFDLEAEYEKYKAAQRAHIVKPEWQRLAEEDLKDLLTKPEFRLSANMVNWLAQKQDCSNCGKSLTSVNYAKHIKTCEKKSKILLEILENFPEITITEIEEKTQMNRNTIRAIFKLHGIKHKFSKKSNLVNHPVHGLKFKEMVKKSGLIAAERAKAVKLKKFEKLFLYLPDIPFPLITVKNICKDLGLKGGHPFCNKFLEENWIILFKEGSSLSNTNPHLYIKNSKIEVNSNIVSESEWQSTNWVKEKAQNHSKLIWDDLPENRYKKAYNHLPEGAFTFAETKRLFANLGLYSSHYEIERFLNTDWVILFHQGVSSSHINPFLYIKNPAKADS